MAGRRLEPLSSRFARVRVRPAHRDYDLTAPRPKEWLLIEWPQGEAEPAKYWFSTLPEGIDFTSLVGITKLRWRIERDYLDLKQEIGIGHYEGRGWRGFHHHATLCIAAYAFLISERETIPPQDLVASGQSKKLVFPKVTGQEDMPLRPERHMPNSIATLKRRIAAALARALPRCPCCGGAKQSPTYRLSL